MKVIEYKVYFRHHDPIVFCGIFESVEVFNNLISQPGGLSLQGRTGHHIISVTDRKTQ